jgi:hypothetical protein
MRALVLFSSTVPGLKVYAVINSADGNTKTFELKDGGI